MTFWRLLPISLLFAAFSVAADAMPLTPHSAEYKVKISIGSGRLNTRLEKNGDGYVANHVVRPTGLARIFASGTMNVTSEFAPESGGLAPVRFQSVDTIKDDPPVDVRFDWSSNSVSGTVGEDAFEQQLDGMSYDNVSIQYELMRDLMSGSIDKQYVLFDVDKMRIANVTNVGTRTVKTKAGTYEAVGIRHQKEGSSRTTTLWCVEELGYLPAIIEQHRKGKLNFRASLISYNAAEED